MADPCGQEVRLKTLEMILEQVSDTLIEQKEIGKSTLEKLTVIAVQGEQIKSLTARVDKAEKDIEWQYDRVRKAEGLLIKNGETRLADAEKALVKVSDFMAAHEKTEDNRSKISIPVIAGLILAAIVAAVGFTISMVDRHNYTQPTDAPAAVLPQKPKTKEGGK